MTPGLATRASIQLANAPRARRAGRLGTMRLSRLIVPVLVLAVSGCTSSTGPGAASSPGSATAPAATQSPPRPGAWDWPNYHRDPAHTGLAAAAPPAGPGAAAGTPGRDLVRAASTRHEQGDGFGPPGIMDLRVAPTGR